MPAEAGHAMVVVLAVLVVGRALRRRNLCGLSLLMPAAIISLPSMPQQTLHPVPDVNRGPVSR